MKNKKLRIGLDIALIIIGIVFLIFGIKDAVDKINKAKVPDNVQFSKDYREIEEENIYKYLKSEDAQKFYEKSSGVLLIGNKSDAWMHVLVKPLNDIVKESYENIYYLEADNGSETLNKFNINKTPCIIILEDGNILVKLESKEIFEKNFEGAPIEYFTEERIDNLKSKLKISELK